MRFIQLHFLTSYPASLLNRDDAGMAKRIPFGGVTRTRVSSQCLKRHWRTFEGTHSLSELGGLAIRSRETFEREIFQRLVEERQLAVEPVRAATRALMAEVLGESAKSKKEGAEAKPACHTSQVTVLGRPEIAYLADIVADACRDTSDAEAAAKAVTSRLKDKEFRKNLLALRQGAGLDAALFGRMITGDILARVDAAVHVAHAFTVHAEETESDYFTAVDDLRQGGDDEAGSALGAGHVNAAELTSGLYYGYVAIDVPLLVSNLEGCRRQDWLAADRELAGRVVSSLVHLVATVSPGAKLGATAPHSFAHLVLVEATDEQPCTLANAFLQPVCERPDLLANTYRALATHITQFDAMYGPGRERRLAAMGPGDALEELLAAARTGQPLPLRDLAAWAESRVNDRVAVAAGV